MLPKNARVNRRGFQEVLRLRGALFHSELFSAKLVRADKKQVGLIVSKKVAKSAVERHSIRRRLYSNLRPLLSLLPEKTALIITAKKNATSSILSRELVRAVHALQEKLK